MSDPGDSSPTVRVDRWLLAARVFKTRPLCQQACEGGKVSVNGARASSHKPVRAGDRVRIQTERGLRDLEVRGLGEKRLPSADALLLYADHSPPPEPRPEASALGGPVPDRGAGRPSKRDRRAISRLRGR
ncbi:RNA-binding S4 domain-containing protein [bacterium]|nr:RNA-binding S4 domain-containing protein [bacterium]